MIEQQNTYNRLVKAIEEGAQLRLQFSRDFDGGLYYLGAWVVKNGQRVEIDMELANRISKHPDIREGYAGYRSDYGRRWEEMFEHRNAPVPRWVSEQWTFE